MAYPRQFRRQHDDEVACAPYNFVPLPERVYSPTNAEDADHSCYMAGRHTGKIEVTLKAETWLYTRAAVSPAYARDHDDAHGDIMENAHSSYREFFHHGDPQVPVIPGSSMRGMLRQLIEVLSDGALTTASSDGLVYRGMGGPTGLRSAQHYRQRFVGPHPTHLEYPVRNVQGGYLFRRGRDWFIQPALADAPRYHESFVRYAHAPHGALPAGMRDRNQDYPVWVEPAPRHATPHHHGLHLNDPRTNTPPVHGVVACPGPGWVRGRLVVTDGLGGVHPKHMHLVIFEANIAAPTYRVPAAMRAQFERDFDVQRDRNHLGRWPVDANNRLRVPEWNEHGAFQGWPCFYMVEGGNLVYFGGTLFFRLPYTKAPADFASRAVQEDLASRLFGGLIGSGAQASARKGRVRVGDLVWDGQGDSPFLPDQGGYRSPGVLLAPKPACIQNYLVQPATDPQTLLHYDDPPVDPANPTAAGRTLLRGFKHYWHRRDPTGPGGAQASSLSPDDAQMTEQRKIRTIVRPVREGTTFKGEIHFDNVTDEELGALLLALELRPDLPEGQRSMRHKLGMARKNGYGSVRVGLDAVRVVHPSHRHASFFDGDSQLAEGWHSDAETTTIRKNCLRAFAACLANWRRAGTVPEDVVASDAIDKFWKAPRMQELAALLEWSGAPDQGRTKEIPVPSDQWRNRWPLPSPCGVCSPNGNVWQGVQDPPPATNCGASAGGSPSAPDTDVPTPVVPPPQLLPAPAVCEWSGVSLSWNAGGGGVLTAAFQQEKAYARGTDATMLRNSLGDSALARLNKKGLIKVNATIEHDGNAWRILKVTPL